MARIIALAISGIVLLGASARGDSFTFSFTNTLGNVSGTVTGEILGLTNNSTGPASEVIITSFPTALNSQFGNAPLNATGWTVLGNTFTESGGVITDALFGAVVDYPSSTSAFFVLDAPISGGSFINALSLDLDSSNSPFTGPTVQGPDGFSGVTYTPTPVPEPRSVVLVLTALLAIAFAPRKRIAQNL